jgi:hypothetical protein
MFSYTEWALTLLKAAGHKYIKRIPYQSGGKLRYRYIYNVTHTHQGKHVLDPDHMKVGTKLMLDATSGKEVHGHITDVRGDLVSFEYDDGPRKGEVVTMGKERLAAELDKVHGISEKLSTARAKQKAVLDKLKERGASEKQIAREQRRLDALGGEAEKVEPKKAEPKKVAPKDVGEHAALLRRISELRDIMSKDSSMHFVSPPSSLTQVARSHVQSAFEKIEADPSSYAPPTLNTEERTVPFYAMTGKSKRGRPEYGTYDVPKQVINEAWVPSGYSAVLEEGTISMTILDGEHAGKSAFRFPASLVASPQVREAIQALPPLSEDTMIQIRDAGKMVNTLTLETLPYHVASLIDEFEETDYRDEIKTAKGFENALKRELKDAVEYATRPTTRYDSATGRTVQDRGVSEAFEPKVEVTSKKDEGGRRFMISISGQPFGSILVSPGKIGGFEVSDNLSEDLKHLQTAGIGKITLGSLDDSYKASFVK